MTTRREFLWRMPVAALTATPALAGTGARAESPEILRLGMELDQAEAAFHAADAAKAAARARFEATRPAVPLELIVPRGERAWYQFTQEETDAEGALVYPDSKQRPRKILTVAGLEWASDLNSARTKFGRQARQKLPLARAYEDATAAARLASALDEAISARHEAGTAIEILTTSIGQAEVRTLAGAAIQARAILACARISNFERMWAVNCYGGVLAETVVALSTRGEV